MTAPQSPADSLRVRLASGYVRATWFDRLQNGTLRARLCALFEHLPHHGAECADVHNTAAIDLRDDCTDVMFAAVQTGNPETIRNTQLEIIALLDEIRGQAFSVIPVSEVKPFATATIDAVQHASNGLTAMATAGTTRRTGDVEDARRQGHRMELAMSEFDRSSERMLHQKRG